MSTKKKVLIGIGIVIFTAVISGISWFLALKYGMLIFDFKTTESKIYWGTLLGLWGLCLICMQAWISYVDREEKPQNKNKTKEVLVRGGNKNAIGARGILSILLAIIMIAVTIGLSIWQVPYFLSDLGDTAYEVFGTILCMVVFIGSLIVAGAFVVFMALESDGIWKFIEAILFGPFVQALFSVFVTSFFALLFYSGWIVIIGVVFGAVVIITLVWEKNTRWGDPPPGNEGETRIDPKLLPPYELRALLDKPSTSAFRMMTTEEYIAYRKIIIDIYNSEKRKYYHDKLNYRMSDEMQLELFEMYYNLREDYAWMYNDNQKLFDSIFKEITYLDHDFLQKAQRYAFYAHIERHSYD